MTKENAHLFLPIVQAIADGKTLQVKHYQTGEWRDWGYGPPDIEFTGPPENYRIKPEPAMIPLGPEDVPPGSAVRKKDSIGNGWSVVTTSGISAITHGNNSNIICNWMDLYRDYEIKRPGEDWQPCCKPAVE